MTSSDTEDSVPNEVAVIPTRYCSRDPLPTFFSDGVFQHDSPFKHPMVLFMLHIFLITYISYFLHLLLRRLKQPRIVSSILGGILIGPSVPYLFAIILGKWSKLEMLQMRDDYINSMFTVRNTAILRTLAYYGVTFNLFLTGVKLNPTQAWRQGMRAFSVGICSFFIPLGFLVLFSAFLRSRLSGVQQLPVISIALSTTAFPVLGEILMDLRLLNTELGRLSMSASLMNDIVGWTFLAIMMMAHFEHTEGHNRGVVVLCFFGFLLLIVCVFWPWIRFVDRRTENGRVSDVYINSILLFVMVVATLGDAIGASFMQGPIIMGLLVPDGSAIAVALNEKVNLVVSEVLLPLVFIIAGMVTDVRSLGLADDWYWMQLFIFVAVVGKFMGTVLPALYYKTPLRSAALLGLIMNFKGLVEVITFVILRNGELLSTPVHTHLLISMLVVTAVFTALVGTFYDPLKSNAMADCRNLQQLKPSMELRLAVPVLNDEAVPTIIPFVEACCGAGNQSPVVTFVLHLVEIAGRASSNLVRHKNAKGMLIDPSAMDQVFSPFINFEQLRQGSLVVDPFTATSPFKSMHLDISSLALEKDVAFIVLPFPRKDAMAVTNADHEALRNVLPLLLSQAPCSMGILIHHVNKHLKLPNPNQFQYRVELLFWGGPDDREALFVAVRMAQHRGVQVRVTRFVSVTENREDQEQHILDSVAIRDFKYRCNTNERLSLDELAFDKAEDMVSAIRGVDKNCDLVIVGRKQPYCWFLEEGLAEWAELPELGLVGDLLASSDFADVAFSILSVQYHA